MSHLPSMTSNETARRKPRGHVGLQWRRGRAGVRSQIARSPAPQTWRRWRTWPPSPLPPFATRKQRPASVALRGSCRHCCVLHRLTPLPMCFEPKKNTSFQHCCWVINNKRLKKAPHISYTQYLCIYTTDVHPYYRVKRSNSRSCTITVVIFREIVTDQKWYMHHIRVKTNMSMTQIPVNCCSIRARKNVKQKWTC
jgi:hypothetical protein